ncbi:hypothetical protein [Sulfurimonas sp.]|uniref:hypothetical protein n=1 Tax=Sulfurimonas sp. TaxID=2022749 RepID=UPI00261AFD01|nr:hypothetical protein [Sulfurimonas sp.]MDD3452590.1 hypothetical protein [Sulfurimonas sp.]
MDDKQVKSLLVETLQENIRLKQQVWELSDKITPRDNTTKAMNEIQREEEIKEVQDILGDLLGI